MTMEKNRNRRKPLLGEKVYYLDAYTLEDGLIRYSINSFKIKEIVQTTFLDKGVQKWKTSYVSTTSKVYNAVGCFNTVEALIKFHREMLKSLGFTYKNTKNDGK